MATIPHVFASATSPLPLSQLDDNFAALNAAKAELTASTTPLMDGAAAIGSATTAAKADHVHPTDTEKASVAQATSAVAITGGSINSTPIGATTPSTGAFTSLSASGNISSTLDASIHGMTVGLGGGSVASNTAVGLQALLANTTGYGSTANGYGSLYLNTTGWANTASGAYSLYSNTTGYNNTASGVSSLYSNTTGYDNTANGMQALYSNTTGADNTANGMQALYSNTTGSSNTANGYQSLYSNTTGSSNTAIGFQSLYYNTTGVSNAANGQSSLFSNTTGNQNTAIGLQAGYGAAGVNANTTGSNNTFLGFQTVGAGAADTNEIVIGANAVGLGSNTTVIGSASTTMSNIKGRVLIGTATDDGVNALQVNGAGIFAGLIKPQQATTAGAPAYDKGAIYFDTTLNKLRVGGATAWETVTSI